MSFYIVNTANYEDRKANLIVTLNKFQEENPLQVYHDIIRADSSFDGAILDAHCKRHLLVVNDYSCLDKLLMFASKNNLDSIELVIDELNPTAINKIATYLYENELSIGLLIKDGNLISNNLDLIQKYSIYLSHQIFEEPFDGNHFDELTVHRLKENRITSYELDINALGLIETRGANCSEVRKHPQKVKELEIRRDLEEGFKDKLFRYLAKSKKTNIEVYKKGGITKQVFSKAISQGDYIPKKNTIICLIIGMELDIDDALDLLNAAGYTLSNSIRLDKVVRTYIELGNYNLIDINDTLDKYHEPVLGWNPREEK